MIKHGYTIEEQYTAPDSGGFSVEQDPNLEARKTLASLIADITPPPEYFPRYINPDNYEFTAEADTGDIIYIRHGAAAAIIQTLPKDETFEHFAEYKNRGEHIPAGTHAVALKDITPYDQVARIDGKYYRNMAKLYMTADMLRLVWNAQERAPNHDTFYGVTNADMANFMRKHWGFTPLRDGDAEVLDSEHPSEDSYVVTAKRADIEAMYPHLAEYIPTLIQREHDIPSWD